MFGSDAGLRIASLVACGVRGFVVPLTTRCEVDAWLWQADRRGRSLGGFDGSHYVSLYAGTAGMAAFNSQLVTTSTGSLTLLSFCASGSRCTTVGTTMLNLASALPSASVCDGGGVLGNAPLNATFDPYSGNLYWVADAAQNALCELTACQLYNACQIASGTSSAATTCTNPGSCCAIRHPHGATLFPG
jgi:hypothetical protein